MFSFLLIFLKLSAVCRKSRILRRAQVGYADEIRRQGRVARYAERSAVIANPDDLAHLRGFGAESVRVHLSDDGLVGNQEVIPGRGFPALIAVLLQLDELEVVLHDKGFRLVDMEHQELDLARR